MSIQGGFSLYRSLALSLAMLTSSAPARAQFGPLAPGALQWTLDGVEAEIGVTFAMNPRFLAGRVPRGLTPLTVGALAKGDDSASRALLARHPDRANYIIAIFSAAAIDSIVVAGSAAPVRPSGSALWWIPAVPRDSAAMLDPRVPRGDQLIELAFWSADADFARRLHGVMPSAAVATVRLAAVPVGAWHIRFEDSGTSLTGTCQPKGLPRPASYSLPQYSTVWSAGPAPGAFVVYTYYGHRVRECEGSWNATGSSRFARAFRDGTILRVDEQTGWRARAAAYAPR
jgi:hypothetical protein